MMLKILIAVAATKVRQFLSATNKAKEETGNYKVTIHHSNINFLSFMQHNAMSKMKIMETDNLIRSRFRITTETKYCSSKQTCFLWSSRVKTKLPNY